MKLSEIKFSLAKGAQNRIKISKSFNGDNRDRTGNLRLAKPALSQLSYIPGNGGSPDLPDLPAHPERRWWA